MVFPGQTGGAGKGRQRVAVFAFRWSRLGFGSLSVCSTAVPSHHPPLTSMLPSPVPVPSFAGAGFGRFVLVLCFLTRGTDSIDNQAAVVVYGTPGALAYFIEQALECVQVDIGNVFAMLTDDVDMGQEVEIVVGMVVVGNFKPPYQA